MIEFIATIICGCLSATVGLLVSCFFGMDGIAFLIVMIAAGGIAAFPIIKIGNIIVDMIYKFREKNYFGNKRPEESK